ncbi:DUF2892 domain-containing protein [Streptomyces sp. NPDC001890]|uniref:YgaP family membrane protein n=1 Tax=Streptomyces sp. NPDC001890 TaxID=3364620 RepID=UPI0036CDA933
MVGLVLIAGAGSVLALVLELLLIVAGLDLLVTGALGHCPLYAKPGHVPKSGCAAGNSMSSETSPRAAISPTSSNCWGPGTSGDNWNHWDSARGAVRCGAELPHCSRVPAVRSVRPT